MCIMSPDWVCHQRVLLVLCYCGGYQSKDVVILVYQLKLPLISLLNYSKYQSVKLLVNDSWMEQIMKPVILGKLLSSLLTHQL